MTLHHGSRCYRFTSGHRLMTVYLVEVQAKLILRSDVDPAAMPENIYSRISEFISSDDDLIDLEVSAYPLPASEGGISAHR